MAEIRHSRIEINGVSAPVAEAGPSDSSEAAVCLHSVPGSGRDFQWLLPQTGEIVRTIALDLPGFGQADKPRDFPYSIAGYQQWLAPAIDQLGVNRVHLVLHSFHSQTGLMWASMHPQHCASVTLLSAGVLEDYSGNWIANLWKTPIAGEILQAITTRPMFKLVMQRGNWRALPGEWLDELITEDDRDTRRVTLELYRATNFDDGHILREALAPRNLQALVIWGKKDPFISWKYAERQRETFPDAEVHVWDDCGHLPHVQHPQRTAETVVRFLRSLNAGSAAE